MVMIKWFSDVSTLLGIGSVAETKTLRGLLLNEKSTVAIKKNDTNVEKIIILERCDVIVRAKTSSGDAKSAMRFSYSHSPSVE